MAVKNHPDKTALRVERGLPPVEGKVVPPGLPLDQWKSWTFQEYYDESANVAKSMLHSGCSQHSTAAIFGVGASSPAASSIDALALLRWPWWCRATDRPRGSDLIAILPPSPFPPTNLHPASSFGLQFNSPEWFMSEMGAIMAGCKAAGIYPTDTPDQIQFKMRHSGSEIVFLEDASKLDKIKGAMASTSFGPIPHAFLRPALAPTRRAPGFILGGHAD